MSLIYWQAKIVVDLFCFILLNLPAVYLFVNHSAPMAYLRTGDWRLGTGNWRRFTQKDRSQTELPPIPEE